MMVFERKHLNALDSQYHKSIMRQLQSIFGFITSLVFGSVCVFRWRFRFFGEMLFPVKRKFTIQDYTILFCFPIGIIFYSNFSGSEHVHCSHRNRWLSFPKWIFKQFRAIYMFWLKHETNETIGWKSKPIHSNKIHLKCNYPLLFY